MSSSQPKITIGSRGSDLALWQANHVKSQLESLGVAVTIKIIKTRGDKIQNIGFDKMEGKGFFTKEIEEALLNKSIDVAVHSHKDLETNPPAGLTIAAVSEREDPSELLLIRKECVDTQQLFALKANALVGTSSARRKSQMQLFRPDVALKDLRGNVPTRINKLRDGQYDAILLAKAGVSRLQLDLSDLHVETLDPRKFVPAPAQGVLGLQTRTDDAATIQIIRQLNTPATQEQIAIERKVLNLFQGGCKLPLGVYVSGHGEEKQVFTAMAPEWNKPLKRLHFKPSATPERIVAQLQQPVTGTVLITREQKPNSPFKILLEKLGMQVIGLSLIQTQPVAFTQDKPTDWIFFSSSNGVRHYATQIQSIPAAKIGAIGPGTAREIRALGWPIDFEGSAATTAEVAQNFAQHIGNASVLFPGAKESLRTVQKALNPNQVIDLDVYATEMVSGIQIPEADVLVFTSPSNVAAWPDKASLLQKQVIAIGPSTGQKLKENGLTEFTLPWEPSELALADEVLGIRSTT